jgi:hypothetical protein
LWATNGLVRRLDKNVLVALKLTWADIPIEHEARIKSKRVAICLFGEERVMQYIDRKIADHETEEAGVPDWRFIRTLMPSSSVDLASSTRLLFGRLKAYRSELEEILRKEKERGNPDFSDIDDLDDWFLET